MAKLDRLVNLNISLNTTAIATESFSDMMIVGTHAASTARMMAITSAGELLDMGLSASDPIYKAALAAFSQTPTLAKVYIGRRAASKIVLTGEQITAKITLPSGEVLDIDGTAAQCAAALPVTLKATANSDTLTIAADIAVKLAKGAMAITTTESYTDALNEIIKAGGSWYGLVITERTESAVLEVAAWAEANVKLFGTATDDAKVLNGAVRTDIASKLMDKQYFRSFVVFDREATTEFNEAAIMAKCFTFYPGGETWANKRLAGITADRLAEGEYIAASGKNCTTFEMFKSFALTQGGKTAAGEWIDVIRFRDWLHNEMQADVAFALINGDGKIPYTDEGITILANAMQKSLQLGVRRGGIAPEELDENDKIIPSYTIKKPKAAQISPNNKASRVLNDLGGSARLAGAIHVANIKFSLGYE
ncbi:DUF3383 family protein [Kingella sp. (in: b-proteobacteria)]|uniref:DUF3383 family protein n=1 Tax=Kingella sp. (in: b-proteobacteria) TaxID=2020713 RepID=UPI0026DB829F|nr:DUF3383 family protein [Kingella sp. (in: b-proteobacteria)]MDO4657900.1 DUF3383 family protein [Kingella sp. (in: b-proteobacteria)]